MKVRKCEGAILFFRLGMNGSEVPPQKNFLGSTIKLKSLPFWTVRGTGVRHSEGIDKLTEKADPIPFTIPCTCSFLRTLVQLYIITQSLQYTTSIMCTQL